MASISTPAVHAKLAGPVASRTRSKSDLAAELIAAARSGDVRRVRQLLQAGVAVNGAMGPQGYTALHLAAAAGHPGVVQELLAQGADVTARTVRDVTPLLVALSTPAAAQNSDSAAGQIAVAALLLQAGADHLQIFEPEPGLGHSLADIALGQGNSDMLQRLLAAGFSADQQTASGHTLLHLAACCGNEEAVGMLLAHGAAVDAPDTDGWTALFLAAVRQQTAVVKQLLAAGAAATAMCNSGRTLIHCLISNQCAAGPSADAAQSAEGGPHARGEIMQLLIDSGADVNAKDPIGWTPLHDAAACGNTAAAALLLAHGADVRAADMNGMSILYGAARNGHVDMVQMLLDAGAEAAQVLEHAVLGRHTPVIEVLLQHKSQPPSLDTVITAFTYAMLGMQQQDADNEGVLAILLLHLCLLAQHSNLLLLSALCSAILWWQLSTRTVLRCL